MGTELGTAYLQIMPSAKGMKANMEKIVGGDAESAGASAGMKLAGKLKGVLAAAGIGAALKKSLDIGGSLEQSFGGLDTLYGDAAAKAKEYAKEAYQAGVSTNSYAEQAVSFGAALKQAYEGDTAKAVEAANTAIMDMTDNAAKMGTPLDSIQNAYQGFAKQNYTMLDNLKLGYGGTKQEMERLLEDASKLSGVEYNIDNLGDVYEAIHVIQEDLGLTGVAAQEASETFSGSFGAMKAAAENMLGNLMLGEDIAPSMEALVQTTVTFLGGNLIPAVGRIFASLPRAISTAISTLHPILMQGLTTATSAIKANFPTMLKNALTGLLNFSETLRSNAGQLVDAGLEMIKSIADGIIQNIPTIVETVPTIISNFAGLINDNAPKILSTGLSIMKNLALGIIKAIPVIIQNIPQILKAIWDVFTAFQWVNLGKTLISGISKGIKGAASGIKGAVKNITNNIKSIFSEGIGAAKTRVSTLFSGIKDTMSSKLGAAKDVVKGIIDKLKNFFPLSIGRIFSNLKIPHISVSGGSAPFGIGGMGTKPSISVSWYDKAMGNPYLFSNATLFGAGETGDEVLYGRQRLMNDISQAVENGGGSQNGDIVINLNYTASDDATDMIRDLTRQVKRYRMAGAI